VITEGTVKTHVQSILRKLAASNRAEAVSLWIALRR
jgi:DNA-binding NarL/FixJ family response regulator